MDARRSSYFALQACAALWVLGALLVAPPASAAPGDLTFRSCFSDDARSGCTPVAGSVEPLGGAELDRLHKASAWQGDDDLVFAHPVTGRPYDRSKLLKRYKAALRRAEVRPVRFHDLRHTFGTRMAAAGVPMRTIQEWMGHADFKTTLIYADYSPSAHEAEWVNAAFAPASPVSPVPAVTRSG